jgi:hypothetical protein
MKREDDKWKGPLVINKICDQQVELVNFQGRKIKTLIKLKDLKNYNDHNIHTRKEYKEEAKQTREQKRLLSDKEQEDIEIHHVMMECYSINVFKISINKQPKDLTGEEENLENKVEEERDLSHLKNDTKLVIFIKQQ